MLDSFRNLNTISKILVGSVVVLGVITVACIITVLATGGLTNPF